MTVLLALCSCVSLSVVPAASPEDAILAAREIIGQQIQAFLNDDPATAYAFASPAIREKFPTEAGFFDMVRRQYAPVYRPGNFAFGRARQDGGMILQEVLISGPDGKDWTALYQLLRQPDDSYRINAMHLVPAAPGPDI